MAGSFFIISPYSSPPGLEEVLVTPISHRLGLFLCMLECFRILQSIIMQ